MSQVEVIKKMNKTDPPPYLMLSVKNDVFTTYCFWAGMLVFKMLLMSVLTAYQRMRKKVPIAREDLAVFPKGAELKHDEDVERVRRAHQNDLENILPFLIIGFLYVLTDPQPTVACWLYRIASVSRILHTIVYCILPIKQPARFICFFIVLVITIYMCFVVMIHFFVVHF